jgi:tetratricopeptide (TPR) repeat protein
MKNLSVLMSLLFLSSSFSVLAADAGSCRQLLASQLPAYAEAGESAAYFDDAEKVYRDCRSASLPVDIRVQAFVKYGRAKHLRGGLQAAIGAFREAIAILDRAPGDQTTVLIAVLDHTVSAESDAHLRSDAIAHANRALTLRRATFGEDSPEAVMGRVKLGLVHATFEEYGMSESLLRTAVLIAEKTCGPECDVLAQAYSGMSAFYATQGNEAEAKKYDEMALNAISPITKRTSRGKD